MPPAHASTPACYETRRQLAEEFAITARLFAEAVVVFAEHKGYPILLFEPFALTREVPRIGRQLRMQH